MQTRCCRIVYQTSATQKFSGPVYDGRGCTFGKTHAGRGTAVLAAPPTSDKGDGYVGPEADILDVIPCDLALDHGLSSRGRHVLMMANVIFRCPASDLNVQYQLDDDPDISDNEYEGIMCPGCTRMHLLNRKTGKLLDQNDE